MSADSGLERLDIGANCRRGHRGPQALAHPRQGS